MIYDNVTRILLLYYYKYIKAWICLKGTRTRLNGAQRLVIRLFIICLYHYQFLSFNIGGSHYELLWWKRCWFHVGIMSPHERFFVHIIDSWTGPLSWSSHRCAAMPMGCCMLLPLDMVLCVLRLCYLLCKHTLYDMYVMTENTYFKNNYRYYYWIDCNVYCNHDNS